MSAPHRTGRLPGDPTTIALPVRPAGGPTVPRGGTLVPIRVPVPTVRVRSEVPAGAVPGPWDRPVRRPSVHNTSGGASPPGSLPTTRPGRGETHDTPHGNTPGHRRRRRLRVLATGGAGGGRGGRAATRTAA